MQIPNSKQYKNNNKRLIQSSKKKAVIVNANPYRLSITQEVPIYPANGSGTINALSIQQLPIQYGGTVDLYFVENPQTIIKGISTALSIDLTNLQTPQKCIVDVFDESNLRDVIVAYIY